MQEKSCDKMIIAIIQGSDYRLAIDDLNEAGFFVTVLNSSGGFLRKQNVTIMMGLNHEDWPRAVEILKRHGRRTEMRCSPNASGAPGMTPMAPMAIPMVCGGVVIFTLDVADYQRH